MSLVTVCRQMCPSPDEEAGEFKDLLSMGFFSGRFLSTLSLSASAASFGNQFWKFPTCCGEEKMPFCL